MGNVTFNIIYKAKSLALSKCLSFQRPQLYLPTFFIRLLHSVHFREILSGYFLFSRSDWSIFVTQLVARHLKEIIRKKCFDLKMIAW
jgi:hypothetical protein